MFILSMHKKIKRASKEICYKLHNIFTISILTKLFQQNDITFAIEFQSCLKSAQTKEDNDNGRISDG